MERVELYHPVLGATITASESAAKVHLRKGWEYADEAGVEPEMAADDEVRDVPASPDDNEKEGP